MNTLDIPAPLKIVDLASDGEKRGAPCSLSNAASPSCEPRLAMRKNQALARRLRYPSPCLRRSSGTPMDMDGSPRS